ncbi:MAG: 6-phosphogluconate dehydrogenase [Anaerolineae bacterium SM23_ 63]|nr:MAG: 6-phosphogluconate dehydrogenase [Anaerolineae bacterium SM23_ 63]HEY47396.1 decarboxylating 6-phosphogluconate dehydrogenase [Anaerolineae bacterium]
MELGMVGLGKMGANMTTRLVKDGHRIVVFDRNPPKVEAAEADGADGSESLEELVSKLSMPRAIWLMVQAGDATQTVIDTLVELLSPGDILIDGGNSNYKDTMRRASELKENGLDLVDVGTSGGIWGLSEGYSMMIGGRSDIVERLRPIFKTLAPGPDRGWGHVGPSGAGHFVKMVHNGIEYGLMQAYAEGFEIMKSKEDFNLDLRQIAEIWRYGSVVRSWLLDLTAKALKDDQDLSDIKGWVADSGEGRWTVKDAIDLDVPAPVITLSLLMRFVSRQEDSYAAKMLAAMRQQFGGHAVKPSISESP